MAVNGAVLTTPATLVGDGDVVTIDGTLIKNKPLSPRLWRYYKPVGLVTTHRDERGRDTVFDHLPSDLPRVVSVGRLDVNSEGLLLLTTSGALARAMELPSNALERTYRVRVHGAPAEESLRAMRRGVTIDGVHYAPIEVALDGKETGRNRWLTVTLREGKNREIRRIFEHFGHPVNRLIRTQYGAFTLGDLTPGEAVEVPTPHAHGTRGG